MLEIETSFQDLPEMEVFFLSQKYGAKWEKSTKKN